MGKKAKDESADLIEKIIESAEQHGRESEPDMEVGDLQNALREAWVRMTPEQRNETFAALDLWS